jgi:tetratricopeptide (TPR) repeat protein/SAM-dependent methyltransferase
VNRRQRRTADRQPSAAGGSGSGAQSNFDEAIRHHQAGRLGDAERCYRRILDIDPRHADSLHLLGVAAFQQERFEAAIELIGRALAVAPDYPEALSNLGNALVGSGRLDDGIASYRKAIEIRPNYPEAHLNLGHVLLRQGKLREAADSYRKTLQLSPNNVQVMLNLGNILGDTGQADAAIDCYRRALALRPNFAEAHTSLGVTLYGLGRLDEAIAAYRRALEINPDLIIALNNLAAAFVARGEPAAALDVARRSLTLEESDDAKGILAFCLGRLPSLADSGVLRPIVIRALSESWGAPNELACACIDLLKLDNDIAGCVARAAEAWPRALPEHVLFGARGLAALAGDRMLSALLRAAPVCDVEMEWFLTMARRVLLDAAYETSGSEAGLGFYSALAHQCFINEYVFCVSTDELRKADELQESVSAALLENVPIQALQLAAVAAYHPLCSLPLAARLLERSWPGEVEALLTQQVREPAEEQRMVVAVPRLTDIDDEVSRLVQQQYEESPYPRWLKVPPSRKADSIEAHLRQTFPLADFDRVPTEGGMEILVAGCGTGQQPIRTAHQFPRARILAIDLGRSGLGYAQRKTRELGISTIEYAQADLLELGVLDRHFDVIEAVGVLHHLADPLRGWQSLLALLRPGGFMRLGLYSDTARQGVVRLQNEIADQGYGTTADDIRRCRRDLLMALGKDAGAADGRASDLFTMSGFRDLLLHVQEHRFSLLQVARFLQDNELIFLGFDIAPDVLHRYRARFPSDPAAIQLSQWQVFEDENPQTFVGMYQFWIQRRHALAAVG